VREAVGVYLTKLHGLGNDFLVALEERDNPPTPLTGTIARALCDRTRGVGADGLIIGRSPDDPTTADLRMELRNADGSSAEMSGNGIRCLAHAVALHRGLDALELRIQTDGGLRSVEIAGAGTESTCGVTVGMGAVASGPVIPPDLDVNGARVGTVTVGNPHLVIDVADPGAIDLAAVGPALEARFPDGINVEFIHATAFDTLTLTVWERGAGITQACGTGAVAAAHVANTWGQVGDRVRVQMPGGDATVVLGDELQLVGPSVHIAEIHVDLDALLETFRA
jgi:diaminopimelate epimerase